MNKNASKQNGRPDGEQRKADARRLLAERRRLYLLRARRALVERAVAVDTATADDVREAVELPPNINPSLFGAVPGPLVRAGIIRPGPRVASERTPRRTGANRLWILKDLGAALRWLADNPDRPDPEPGPGEQALPVSVNPKPKNGPSSTRTSVEPGVEAM